MYIFLMCKKFADRSVFLKTDVSFGWIKVFFVCLGKDKSVLFVFLFWTEVSFSHYFIIWDSLHELTPNNTTPNR